MKNEVVKNNLGYSGDLFVYQDKSMFNYSVDTILLGNFVSINRKVKNILEVGTNNGALSIFIAARDNVWTLMLLKSKAKLLSLQEKILF